VAETLRVPAAWCASAARPRFADGFKRDGGPRKFDRQREKSADGSLLV